MLFKPCKITCVEYTYIYMDKEVLMPYEEDLESEYGRYFSYSPQMELIDKLETLKDDLENIGGWLKRRVSYPQELLTAYWRWNQGDSQSQIYVYLRNKTEYETVGQRTITRWLSWFKDIPQKDVELDRTGFYFHKMDDYGVPWDKYEEVMRLVEEYSTQQGEDLTPRMAKWVLRLQQIKNPTFDRDKAKTFIKRFVEAEQEELIGVESREDLNKVSEDLQYELSKWDTRPVGTTRRT